jgi:hypothetical protein
VLDGFCCGSGFFLYKSGLCLRRSESACRQWTKAWLLLLLLPLHRPHRVLLPLLLL